MPSVYGRAREISPDADGQFSQAPIFNDGQLKFNTTWIDNANDNYGYAGRCRTTL
jgi:hypothetical protein